MTAPNEPRDAVARTITMETATIYRAGGRRWFTLKAACRAAAKERMRQKFGHDWASEDGDYGPVSVSAMDLVARIARRYLSAHRRSEHIAPRDAEIERPRADAERSEKHRNDLMDAIVSLRTERGALREQLAVALSKAEAAMALAERAEDDARDARHKAALLKADWDEIDKTGALSHAEEADAEIDRLNAALSEERARVAGMPTLPAHRLLTLRRMLDRADRMQRCFYRDGCINEGVIYREEVDALQAVLSALTPEPPHAA